MTILDDILDDNTSITKLLTCHGSCVQGSKQQLDAHMCRYNLCCTCSATHSSPLISFIWLFVCACVFFVCLRVCLFLGSIRLWKLSRRRVWWCNSDKHPDRPCLPIPEPQHHPDRPSLPIPEPQHHPTRTSLPIPEPEHHPSRPSLPIPEPQHHPTRPSLPIIEPQYHPTRPSLSNPEPQYRSTRLTIRKKGQSLVQVVFGKHWARLHCQRGSV